LVAMNCLRPFQQKEIERLGGKEAFLPSSWTSVTVGDDEQVWGIPVRSDVRVLWYWKDMLEKAGLDPESAFSSFENFPATFEALKPVCPFPWAAITPVADFRALQVLASWIWKAGGDFLSKDGKSVLFYQKAAREGMHNYFDLHRFIDKEQALSTNAGLEELFLDRRICAAISGPNMLGAPPERREDDRVGVTLIPGPSFVGGTVMVIYDHCREAAPALDFLEFIAQPDIQLQYARVMYQLPPRHSTWKLPEVKSDPFLQTLYQALSQGRSYPAAPLWGIVEQKLLSAVAATWDTILRQEKPDVEAAIEAHIGSLAERLELTLNS
jgi:multiple sugar transport system substrate-binding protein